VGLAEVLQQTPHADTAAPPSEVTAPPLLAEVVVIADIAVVVSEGITIVGVGFGVGVGLLSSFLQDINKITISKEFKIKVLFTFILICF
jgi:type III secretory pathway component EscT